MHPWSNDDVLAPDPAGFLDRITMMGMCLVSSGLVPQVGEAFLREMTDATPLASTMRPRLPADARRAPARPAVARAARGVPGLARGGRRRAARPPCRLQRRSGRLSGRSVA